MSAFGKVSRKPETAGKVCTISPREPRRTTKKRGSGMRRLANGFKKVARGMIFGVADDGNFDAEACGRGALGHRFCRVVGSFGMNVRTEVFEERFNARFAEEENVIDGAKGGDEEGAGVLIENGTTGAFQRTDARIRVDADNEDVALKARTFEITDVPYVKRIKTSIRKDDALSTLFVLH